jgi:hypothetical protein
VLEAAGENPLGHDLDPRRGTDDPLVPRPVAHRVAHILAEQRRHAAGGRPGRQASWFEHHDAALAQPRLVEEP